MMDIMPHDEGRESHARGVETDHGEPLGSKLTQSGLITPEQAQEIGRHQKDRGIRYGEAAIELQIMSRPDLDRFLSGGWNASEVSPAATSRSLAVLHDIGGRADSDYRSLRNVLDAGWFRHPEGARSLAIVSPDRGDGRSLVAANLAVSFAQANRRTLLIDADLRAPRQNELFALNATTGLETHLEQTGFDGIPLYRVKDLDLFILPSAATRQNSQELLLGSGFRRLIDDALQRFDLVIVDTPAGSLWSDYQIIGSVTDGAMFVVRQNRSRVRSLAPMVKACADFGIRVVGSTMVDAAT